MSNLQFEELEKVEEMDAKDLGAAFGVAFVASIIVYVGIAAT